MIVIYTALRKLKSGVNYGDQITVDIPVQTLDTGVEEDVVETTSYDGTIESSVNYMKDNWKVVTEFGNGLTNDDYKQFLFSVRGNVPFQFEDPDNDNALTSVVTRGRFTSKRNVQSILKEFNYTFTMRVI